MRVLDSTLPDPMFLIDVSATVAPCVILVVLYHASLFLSSLNASLLVLDSCLDPAQFSDDFPLS